MRWLGSAFLLLSLGCSCISDVDPWPGAKRTTLTHKRGFSIQLPENVYRVDRTDHGFDIRPLGAGNMRTPTKISVRLETEAIVPGDWIESKRVGNYEVYYRVAQEAGGSGGDLYTFEAWIPLGQLHVRLKQLIQAETIRPPHFAEAWAIAVSVDR